MPSQYRPRNRLEFFISGIVTAVYNNGETPMVNQITTKVINDPRFTTTIMTNAQDADRVLRHGVERSVRNVLTSLVFTGGGVYDGRRACLLVPVPGRKAGYLQFTNRLTVHELELIRDRMTRSVRGLVEARDHIQAIIDDLRARGVDRLEDAYGNMAIGL